MNFFGAVSINFNTINPYLESEDFMNITVTRDWDYQNNGSLENVWLDLRDSWSNIPEYAPDGYVLEFYFKLIELDGSQLYDDSATFAVAIGSDVPEEMVSNYYEFDSPFHSIPPIGATVQATCNFEWSIYQPPMIP